MFMVAIPLSSFFGSPLSAALLTLDGAVGLRGWQWLLIAESIPAVLLGLAALAMLPSRPAEARFLTAEQKTWLEGRLEAERQLASAGHSGHGSIWSVLTNKYVLVLAIIYSGSSATSNTLSLWMPQILKSFGLGNMETGLLNMIPFGIASVFMIFWGLRADKSGERICPPPPPPPPSPLLPPSLSLRSRPRRCPRRGGGWDRRDQHAGAPRHRRDHVGDWGTAREDGQLPGGSAAALRVDGHRLPAGVLDRARPDASGPAPSPAE